MDPPLPITAVELADALVSYSIDIENRKWERLEDVVHDWSSAPLPWATWIEQLERRLEELRWDKSRNPPTKVRHELLPLVVALSGEAVEVQAEDVLSVEDRDGCAMELVCHATVQVTRAPKGWKVTRVDYSDPYDRPTHRPAWSRRERWALRAGLIAAFTAPYPRPLKLIHRNLDELELPPSLTLGVRAEPGSPSDLLRWAAAEAMTSWNRVLPAGSRLVPAADGSRPDLLVCSDHRQPAAFSGNAVRVRDAARLRSSASRAVLFVPVSASAQAESPLRSPEEVRHGVELVIGAALGFGRCEHQSCLTATHWPPHRFFSPGGVEGLALVKRTARVRYYRALLECPSGPPRPTLNDQRELLPADDAVTRGGVGSPPELPVPPWLAAFWQAQRLVREENFDEAVTLLETLVDSPIGASAALWLAFAHLGSKDYGRARDWALRAPDLAPAWWRDEWKYVYWIVAIAEGQLGNREAARDAHLVSTFHHFRLVLPRYWSNVVEWPGAAARTLPGAVAATLRYAGLWLRMRTLARHRQETTGPRGR
jgi:hypothetical protein